MNIEIQKETANELLTPEQAAELLQVSKRTMYEWLRNGEIPSERIGERLIRVRRSDILSPDVRSFYEQGCRLGQHPETVNEAEAYFKKAIQLNPHYALAYSTLGQMFIMWWHFQRAIKPLEKALALNPTFHIYLMLGECYRETQNYGKSEKAFRNALEMRVINLEPQHIADIHFQLGFSIHMDAIYHRERFVEAIEQFRKSLEIAPHYKSAHFLGQALVFHSPNYDEALLLADEIQEPFPEEAERIRYMVDMQKGQK